MSDSLSALSAFNSLNALELKAEGFIFNDRMRYKKYMEIAEKFASDNNIIIGGPAASRLLFDEAIRLDSFYYDFYSKHPIQHGRQLCDLLFDDELGKYTTMVTKISGCYFVIAVDTRILFTFTLLSNYKNANLGDVIVSQIRPAPFTRLNVKCMGVDIQLMSVYTDLCDPSKASQWEALLHTERALREMLKFRKSENYTRKKDTPFKKMLRSRFLDDPSRVVLKAQDKLQVITMNDLEDEERDIAVIAKSAQTVISCRIEKPMTVYDSRLRRMTVFHVSGAHREPIIDIYNTASFNLVPYYNTSADSKSIKMATKFAKLRHKLVDIWIIRLMIQMKVINESFSDSILFAMESEFWEISEEKTIMFPETFLGRYEDITTALKKAVANDTKKYPPYMPLYHVEDTK
jgi:hypothetical protein